MNILLQPNQHKGFRSALASMSNSNSKDWSPHHTTTKPNQTTADDCPPDKQLNSPKLPLH